MSDIVRIEREGDIGMICLDKPPVNALGVALRTAIYNAFAELLSDDQIKAIVLYGVGRFFSAGADIKDFARAAEKPTLPDLLKALNISPKPVIAALHGVAFGGALELALSAHLRVGMTGLKIALPEVKLGLLPGAGGTQRFTRLTGIAAAIDVICTGREVSDKEALSLGVVSRIVNGSARDAGLAAAKDVLAGKLTATPTDSLTVEPDAAALSAAQAEYSTGRNAPQRALDAVSAATLPIDEGLAKERALFMELMQGDERAGLVHAFLAERATTKIPESAAATRTIESVGVVGGGTMGTGIAAALCIAGFRVSLIETDIRRVDKARETIENTLAGALKRGKLTEQGHAEALKYLITSADLNELATVDLLIEAIFEDMNAKTELFQKLDVLCKPNAILASNTSYLDINQIAATTSRPGDVIGMHFFSPAHIMRLLEVVVADKTSPDVVATAFQLAQRMRKIPVRSGVCDGFIGNRILTRYRKVCEYLVLDGARFDQVDRALTDFGFAMGPFAVGDLAGLDIAQASRARTAASRPSQERYSRVADLICEHGWYGRKTGKGYYLYTDGKLAGPNPEALAIIESERAALSLSLKTFDDNEIVARCVTAMIQEAVLVLEEGIALRPVDIDAVKLFGYGFPRHRGGPLHLADQIGIDTLITRIEGYSAEDDYFWQVPHLLRDMAKRGQRFEDLNAQYEEQSRLAAVKT